MHKELGLLNLAMGFLVLSIIAEIPRNFGSREHAESLACQWALPDASYTFLDLISNELQRI
jgi:hypothetical protein